MNCFWLYVISSILVVLLSSVSGVPVKFENERNTQEYGQSLQQRKEGRLFHAHAIKKRKKKKLLQCLLGLQRSNPHGDPRTLFFNYFNLEYTQNGGGHEGYDDESGGGGGGHNNCLNPFGGSNNGGGDDDDDGEMGGIGEGINNLGSLVGQAPSNLISSVGDGIRPVFENSERYLNRYIIRPLYRSLRPLYRLF